MKIIVILNLILTIFSCSKKIEDKQFSKTINEDKKKKSEKKKPSLSHYQKDNNHVIIITNTKGTKFKSEQNRIKKNITIELFDLSLEEFQRSFQNDLVKSIAVKQNDNNSYIEFSLIRPIRYSLNKSNNQIEIILYDSNFLSSIKAKSDLVSDFHKKAYNVDLHCDFTIHHFMKKLDFEKGTPLTQTDLAKVKNGSGKSLFYVIWVPDFYVKNVQKVHLYKYYFELFPQYFGEPYKLARDLIKKVKHSVSKNDSIDMALSSSDIIENMKSGKVSALMGMEGAHPLEGNIERLKELYNDGVRYLGITWSNSNAFADAAGYNFHGGLSKKGEKLIMEMMKIGMIIDVSHCSDNTFKDIVRITKYKYPIIASHSNVRTLKRHKRNITPAMLEDIKKSNGIIGVVYHSGFLVDKGRATIENVLDQIDYITQTIGVDYAALGSDFDGYIRTPIGLEDISKLPNLTLGLYNRGYSFEEIEKILGKNFLRVLQKVESLKVK